MNKFYLDKYLEKKIIKAEYNKYLKIYMSLMV